MDGETIDSLRAEINAWVDAMASSTGPLPVVVSCRRSDSDPSRVDVTADGMSLTEEDHHAP